MDKNSFKKYLNEEYLEDNTDDNDPTVKLAYEIFNKHKAAFDRLKNDE